ncbi:MBL fold metallo-hydrolase [Candidatus Cyrtobacter comes]|uniref:MBL fold metallo-hydrolase n=1 Tax=Candidatus Cyrtobacter comes TaxID=675776 RepID=A0ABU5L9N3_9RICK|nr:MBL fold metallo-hydrolase [Candidatus Cyrtobacter comes]MDZ5762833.1 MBL fold metallo-hydrolase [Candidatus Cyrtobacter comes]
MPSICVLLIILFYFWINKISYQGFYNGSKTDHFDGKKFSNIKRNNERNDDKIYLLFLKRLLSGKLPKWPKNVPVHQVNPSKILQNEVDSIFLINHSTMLIKVSCYTILTDPIWSQRTSPVQFLGPKRKAAPGIKIEDLPKIDFILISHDHYDHLDCNTIRQLIQNNDPVFLVGLGVREVLLKIGVNGQRIIELDWWQEYKHIDIGNSLVITFVPAQHFSGRFINNENTTLWGGFVIKSHNNKTIYFAGDTGYDEDQFLLIKRNIGVIDVSLLPIGAYKPDSFRYVHMNPSEAVKASIILGSKVNIPIHFGTFILSFEDYNEPLNDLEAALVYYKLAMGHFTILKNGEHCLY